jgi:hypothetical protein
MKLYKTTITIWTDVDPSQYFIKDLGQKVIDGDAHCSKRTTKLVNTETDPDWIGDPQFFISLREKQ